MPKDAPRRIIFADAEAVADDEFPDEGPEMKNKIPDHEKVFSDQADCINARMAAGIKYKMRKTRLNNKMMDEDDRRRRGLMPNGKLTRAPSKSDSSRRAVRKM